MDCSAVLAVEVRRVMLTGNRPQHELATVSTRGEWSGSSGLDVCSNSRGLIAGDSMGGDNGRGGEGDVVGKAKRLDSHSRGW